MLSTKMVTVSERLPLFVYGTLLSDGAQGGLLAGLRHDRASVVGTLWRLPVGYPAMSLGGDTSVVGELVEAPGPQVLRLVDHYEGVDEGLYRRLKVRACVGLRSCRAWAYVMDSPRLRGGVIVPSGQWRVRRGGPR